MNVKQFLTENRATLVKKWVDLVLDVYPRDSHRFLRKEKNRFANPIGQTVAEEIQILYDELLRGDDGEKIAACLDNILKIQAIQAVPPSRALSFVFQFKGLVRKALPKGGTFNGAEEELEDFENRMDELALLAFDVYSKRRQTIYDLRVNEIRREVSRLLRRANLVIDIPEAGAER